MKTGMVLSEEELALALTIMHQNSDISLINSNNTTDPVFLLQSVFLCIFPKQNTVTFIHFMCQNTFFGILEQIPVNL